MGCEVKYIIKWRKAWMSQLWRRTESEDRAILKQNSQKLLWKLTWIAKCRVDSPAANPTADTIGHAWQCGEIILRNRNDEESGILFTWTSRWLRWWHLDVRSRRPPLVTKGHAWISNSWIRTNLGVWKLSRKSWRFEQSKPGGGGICAQQVRGPGPSVSSSRRARLLAQSRIRRRRFCSPVSSFF